MLRFVLEKLRESPGPLKQVRVIASDLAEEVLDVAEHYIDRALRRARVDNDEDRPQERKEEPRGPSGVPLEKSRTPSESGVSPSRTQKQRGRPGPSRTLTVPDELAAALDAESNRRKQEFKVLAILWDANHRGLGDLSAKEISEHGLQLGVLIRHENVRKIIKMRLENYVYTVHDQNNGKSVYHYRITAPGEWYFKDKYLK
jgi:hypothetical protein